MPAVRVTTPAGSPRLISHVRERRTTGRSWQRPRAARSCGASRAPCRRIDVEQLARHAVWLGRVERSASRPGRPHPCTISASSRIVRSSPVPTLMCSGFVVVLHQEQAGVGEIVDVEELAPRRAGPPDHDLGAARSAFASWNLRISAGSTCELVEVEVVVRSVEVGRHGRDEVAAVLPAVALAQLDAGDLGDARTPRWSARAAR